MTQQLVDDRDSTGPEEADAATGLEEPDTALPEAADTAASEVSDAAEDTPRAARRSRRGASLAVKIQLVSLVSLGAALLVSAVAFVALASLVSATRSVTELQTLQHDVEQIRFHAADVRAWQTAYAWDARRLGPAVAASAKNPNRSGYVASAGALDKLLASTDDSGFTASERKTYGQIQAVWHGFSTGDREIAQLYASGQPMSVTEADMKVIGPEYDLHTQLTGKATALADSVRSRAQADARRASDLALASRVLVIAVLVIGSAAAFLLTLRTRRQILRGVTQMQQAINAMRRGDLTVTPEVGSRDELGQMAASYREAQDSVREVITSVTDLSDRLAAAGDQLRSAAQGIAAGAEQTSEQAQIVARRAAEVSESIHTVAASAEEMDAAVQEISRNAQQATTVAAHAVEVAHTTEGAMTRLGASSNSVGDVVQMITRISGQTKLLALNATIEAARAGQAGAGFAVVADEVKALAEQTESHATQVTERIGSIQSDSTGAVAAIGEIGQVVGSINDFQGSISTSVEQQLSAVASMTRSTAGAASSSEEIATTIERIATTSADSTRVAREVRVSVEELAEMAQRLRGQVARFTV